MGAVGILPTNALAVEYSINYPGPQILVEVGEEDQYTLESLINDAMTLFDVKLSERHKRNLVTLFHEANPLSTDDSGRIKVGRTIDITIFVGRMQTLEVLIHSDRLIVERSESVNDMEVEAYFVGEVDLEKAERISGINFGENIVLILSGLAEHVERLRGRETGDADFVQLPSREFCNRILEGMSDEDIFREDTRDYIHHELTHSVADGLVLARAYEEHHQALLEDIDLAEDQMMMPTRVVREVAPYLTQIARSNMPKLALNRQNRFAVTARSEKNDRYQSHLAAGGITSTRSGWICRAEPRRWFHRDRQTRPV